MRAELRARFKDARFFWDMDQKTPLADRVESLRSVTFQKELGSYHWKTEQNLAVAGALAQVVKRGGAALDEAALMKGDRARENRSDDGAGERVHRAAGRYRRTLFARARPGRGRGQGDLRAVHASFDRGCNTVDSRKDKLLGIADRIQTIVSMFGIGAAPTGSKDPFALRRAANAIVKILAESNLPLTLGDV